jgi:preprotein translocase subunit SecF
MAARGARTRESFLSRLYTGTGAFDVVGKRRIYYIAFGTLVLACVLSIVFRGFNLGIDFTGGTQIQFPAAGAGAPATGVAEVKFSGVIGAAEVTTS